MALSKFNHVEICGIKTVIPKDYIDIDDELEYFDNNPKKLARAKKMIGYGRRYIADDNTTVVDLAVEAAQKLLQEMNVDKSEIDLLIFVNQKVDYPEPCDACVAHGLLGLDTNCTTLDINLGCSGYVHALMTAHAFISSEAHKTCLLLAGDLCGRFSEKENRKAAPVFGDSASATLLRYTSDEKMAYFVTGSDGKGFDKIIRPFGSMRLPFDKKTIDMKIQNSLGNKVGLSQGIIQGEEVFTFTMNVAPQLIKDTLTLAKLSSDDVDLFAIHQANKQIVENIIDKAQIPKEKAPVEIFSKYANHSTNSVVTVLCDEGYGKELKNVLLCTFGVGLSWGGGIVNLSSMYNGGISTYIPPKDKPTQEEQIAHWLELYSKN